jgi:S-layer homology domain
MRRVLHRSVTLALSLSLLTAATVSAGVVPPFSDIAGHRFESDIEWLRQAGLTEGCGGGEFCPDAPVTRGQMATFLVRALELPASTADRFDDDTGTAHEDAINRLAAAGITTGCTATRFCPTENVTRGQMASFLARGFSLPSSATDYFTDDETSIHEPDINRVAKAGITSGCTATTYCPLLPVTRGQMAAFLHRALD